MTDQTKMSADINDSQFAPAGFPDSEFGIRHSACRQFGIGIQTLQSS